MKTGCDIDAPVGDESVGYSPVSERQAERDSPQKGIVIDLPERIHEVSRNKGQQTQEIFWGMYILLFIAPYSAFVGQVPQSFYNPPVLSLAFLFAGFPPYWLMLAGDLVRIWLVVLITKFKDLVIFAPNRYFCGRLIPLSDTPARFLALGLVIPKLVRDYCY